MVHTRHACFCPYYAYLPENRKQVVTAGSDLQDIQNVTFAELLCSFIWLMHSTPTPTISHEALLLNASRFLRVIDRWRAYPNPSKVLPSSRLVSSKSQVFQLPRIPDVAT